MIIILAHVLNPNLRECIRTQGYSFSNATFIPLHLNYAIIIISPINLMKYPIVIIAYREELMIYLIEEFPSKHWGGIAISCY